MTRKSTDCKKGQWMNGDGIGANMCKLWTQSRPLVIFVMVDDEKIM